MELSDLNETERVALVALLEAVIAADSEVTDDEPEKLVEVIAELGEDAYRLAIEEADRLEEEGTDLRKLLATVRRQEPRELIYGTAMEVAMANAVTPQEAPLLEWLAETWGIRIES
jgi:uncharacterized tellurite resistance protein B-like protein